MNDLIEMLFREIVRKIVPNFREKKIEKTEILCKLLDLDVTTASK